MVDQPLETPVSVNGTQKRSRKGIKRQWKDLPIDPLGDGFDEHKASYIIGRSPISWGDLGTGALFSRSKSGKALHIKIDAGHAVCIDTGESLEVAPRHRLSLQVYKVTSINTTTA